jgi:hypothetical protein
VEFALVEEQMQEVDELIEQGRTSLNWNSTGIYAIMYFILFDTSSGTVISVPCFSQYSSDVQAFEEGFTDLHYIMLLYYYVFV